MRGFRAHPRQTSTISAQGNLAPQEGHDLPAPAATNIQGEWHALLPQGAVLVRARSPREGRVERQLHTTLIKQPVDATQALQGKAAASMRDASHTSQNMIAWISSLRA